MSRLQLVCSRWQFSTAELLSQPALGSMGTYSYENARRHPRLRSGSKRHGGICRPVRCRPDLRRRMVTLRIVQACRIVLALVVVHAVDSLTGPSENT
jgi:hypothetical protein